MRLGEFYNGVRIERHDRIVVGRFLCPHLVVSTCSVAGGIRDDLEAVYNYQSCEPSGHHAVARRIMDRGPAAVREEICAKQGLRAAGCATMGTAANMRFAAVAHHAFRDQEVVAVCTGGVETNAGRAGDPASVIEKEGAFERLGEAEAVSHGTINIMLFVSRELTPGALVRSIVTATEAKSAALQELSIPSRYSNGLATGTGTDQIIVSCRRGGGKPLTGTGKHTKLGELIGRAVHEAVRQTLTLQNGLTPESRRSATVLLERFGLRGDAFQDLVRADLAGPDAELLGRNFRGVACDPVVAAAVAALVHVRDQVTWGVLPVSCSPELYAAFGAQIAAATSGRYDRLPLYRETLAASLDAAGLDDEAFVRLVARAVAKGFAEKWQETGD